MEFEQEETVETVENSTGFPLPSVGTVGWVVEAIPSTTEDGTPTCVKIRKEVSGS